MHSKVSISEQDYGSTKFRTVDVDVRHVKAKDVDVLIGKLNGAASGIECFRRESGDDMDVTVWRTYHMFKGKLSVSISLRASAVGREEMPVLIRVLQGLKSELEEESERAHSPIG
jgi:hypothetical protein